VEEGKGIPKERKFIGGESFVSGRGECLCGLDCEA
jgi:hypothetical protein